MSIRLNRAQRRYESCGRPHGQMSTTSMTGAGGMLRSAADAMDRGVGWQITASRVKAIITKLTCRCQPC